MGAIPLALVSFASAGCSNGLASPPVPCPSDLPDDADCGTATPSYASDIAPIFASRCAECHYPGNGQSTQVFETYQQVSSSRQTVLSQVYGCQMPSEGAEPLSADQRRLLLKWLVCGAPEN